MRSYELLPLDGFGSAVPSFQIHQVFRGILKMARRFKEKSIEGTHAKFSWGVKNGEALAALLAGFQCREEHSLTEGMAAFAPIYKLLDKLSIVRNISNKIIVLEKV